MCDVLMFSGGASSFLTGEILKAERGSPPDLLFADTLIEDDDSYRFIVEAAAHLLGVPCPRHLAWMWGQIPDLEFMDERFAHLDTLATEAMAAIPGLHWIADGRDPWQVFKAARFVGNTRAAKCSHVLKQDVCRDWLAANCRQDDTTIHVGIHWSESDRFHGTAKKPGAKELWLPWKCRAVLCEKFLPPSAADDAIKAAGIRRPRLYDFGALHSNCGMFCVKAGQAHFANLLRHFPKRYAYHERREQDMRDFLGKDVAILRDRRGGETRPLTLKEFRERLEAGGRHDPEDVNQGCSCFSSEREEACPASSSVILDSSLDANRPPPAQ